MNAHSTYTLHQGTSPVLVSVPHASSVIPTEHHAGFVERALHAEDADWHLDIAYRFVRDLGMSMIVPVYARYLIDLNRPPDNTLMYANANNTELVPSHFFNGDNLYEEGMLPTAEQITTRREKYWQPYHKALQGELQRLKEKFGFAILWDGHSIRSRIPWLFEGKLDDLNLGTAGGESCSAELTDRLVKILNSQSQYTVAINGRFKGGYITRQYGKPDKAIHAVQLEMCQSTYMEETPPFAFDAAKFSALQPILIKLLKACLEWTPTQTSPQ